MTQKKSKNNVKLIEDDAREGALGKLRLSKLLVGIAMVVLGVLWVIDAKPSGNVPLLVSVGVAVAIFTGALLFQLSLWRKAGQPDEYEQHVAYKQRAASYGFLSFALFLVVVFYDHIPENIPVRSVLAIVLGLSWILDSKANDIHASKKA